MTTPAAALAQRVAAQMIALEPMLGLAADSLLSDGRDVTLTPDVADRVIANLTARADNLTDAVRRLRLAAAALPTADLRGAREHLALVIREIADELAEED